MAVLPRGTFARYKRGAMAMVKAVFGADGTLVVSGAPLAGLSSLHQTYSYVTSATNPLSCQLPPFRPRSCFLYSGWPASIRGRQVFVGA